MSTQRGRSPTRPLRVALLLVIAGLLASCSSGPSTAVPGSGTRVSLTQQHPAMSLAQAQGVDVGLLSADTLISVHLGLAVRDQAGLDTLLAAGTRISPAEYAGRFGPDSGAVARVRSLLNTAGFTSSWSAGDTSIAASASAGDAERLFSVSLHRYVGPDGVHFFAPAAAPTLPASLAGAVTGVVGLDDYPHAHSSAIRSSHGVTPVDMLGFYDIPPLRSAGIDGNGQTIYFIELDAFSQAAFDAFATHFQLPPQQITVVNRSEWGPPAKEEGEADLDIQVAHEIAPNAKLVVYNASQSGFHTAMKQITIDHPGAIVSSSWGDCEGNSAPSDSQQYKSFTDAAAAQGTSIFVASGDRGAYDCTPDGIYNQLSADMDGGTPGVTSVGGTTAFLSSSSNAYFHEAAWGEPAEQWGSAGGISSLWPLPSWQTGPGVQNQYSKGMRQTPDVAANADSESGWEVFAPKDGPVGGTSAAAPFWAAVTALLDQGLAAKQLRSVGFANPVLYYFGSNPAGLPAPPFHDIVDNNNLFYPATPGWDFATGLGSPDVSALLDDWIWYAQTHPNGGTS